MLQIKQFRVPTTLILAVSLSLFLSGCANMTPKVAVSYAPTYPLKGKSFSFVNVDPGTETFDQIVIRKDIGSNLENYGMVYSKKYADYIVTGAIYSKPPIEEDRNIPLFGKTGDSILSSNTYGTVSSYGDYSASTTYNTMPTYGVVGYSSIHETMYPIFLKMSIYPGKYKKQIENHDISGITPIYQSTASLVTTHPNIDAYRKMVSSIFKSFPGVSGNIYNG